MRTGGAGQHDFLGRRGHIEKGFAHGDKEVADRAIANGQSEQFTHQRGQPLPADGRKADRPPWRRWTCRTVSRHQAPPGPRPSPIRRNAEPAHLGTTARTGGNAKRFVYLLRGLRRCREDRTADWAGGQLPVDRQIWVRMHRRHQNREPTPLKGVGASTIALRRAFYRRPHKQRAPLSRGIPQHAYD